MGAECKQCRKTGETTLQRSASPSKDESWGEGAVPPIVHEVVCSSGQPLDASVRAFFEPRFGHDFSHVRVHTDSKAPASVQAVNALAYTVGRDVVFGAKQYAPGTVEGQRLLAHELTHVVQQEAGGVNSVQAKPAMHQPGSPFEREADFMADAVTRSSSSPLSGHTGTTLPYREATELLECIRIMGEENGDYCREVVLGDKPEPAEEAPKWTRKHTTGPRLLDGDKPSYQVWFNHIPPLIPTGVTQMWQVVESTMTFLTDKCELKTEKDFRIDIVDIGRRKKVEDSWGLIRPEAPCFAMEESNATVGFDDQKATLLNRLMLRRRKLSQTIL